MLPSVLDLYDVIQSRYELGSGNPDGKIEAAMRSMLVAGLRRCLRALSWRSTAREYFDWHIAFYGGEDTTPIHSPLLPLDYALGPYPLSVTQTDLHKPPFYPLNFISTLNDLAYPDGWLALVESGSVMVGGALEISPGLKDKMLGDIDLLLTLLKE